MKSITTLLLLISVNYGMSYAQSVGISTEEIIPHPSAALEIRTTQKGILIPRVTQSEKSAIQDPAEGLLVFQTSPPSGFYYFNSSEWILLTGPSDNYDNDNDPLNELQTLSISGDTLFISGTNHIILPEDFDEQTLSLNGDTLSISNGNTVLLELNNNDSWNHIASQNLQIKAFYLSSDGDNEGLRMSTNGDAEFSNDLTIDGLTTVNNITVTGTANLGNAAIQSNEIEALAVTGSKIADDAITTLKIQDAQITSEKLHPMGASTDQFLQFNGSAWAPASISTGLIYLGTWDASTNTPLISDATGSNGNFYIVSVAGSQNLGNGAISFNDGDWAIHNGSNYEKINNSNDVSSIFGRKGIVTAQYGDYSWNMIDMTNSSLNNISDVNYATLAAGNILIFDGTQWISSAVSGDAALTTGGAIKIEDGAVNYNDIQDASGPENTILQWNGNAWEEVLITSIEGDKDSTNEIQSLSLTGTSLSIENSNSVDLSGLAGTNTDAQELSLSGSTLSIENGNSVNLTPFLDNTDEQRLSLSGSDLSIDNGNTVDLSVLTTVNTDDQTLTLTGTTLSIEEGNSVNLAVFNDNTDNQTLNISNDTLLIENGNYAVLTPYVNTDNQLLSLSATQLSIENGNSIDITSFYDNTDAQDLTISGSVLSLTNDNTPVDLSDLQDDLGNHTMSQNLVTNGNYISSSGNNEGIYLIDNGNISIGNAAPDYKLHLTSSDNAVIRIDNSSPTPNALLQLAMNNPAASSGNDFVQFIDGKGDIIGHIEGNGSSVTYLTTSDIRLKENLVSTSFGLNTILGIKVFDYNFIGSDHPQTGFSAQQLYTFFPPAVSVGGDNPKTNPWSVNYAALTPVLTRAIQEMNAKVIKLENENAKLKAQLLKMEKLENRIQKLESILFNQ